MSLHRAMDDMVRASCRAARRPRPDTPGCASPSHAAAPPLRITADAQKETRIVRNETFLSAAHHAADPVLLNPYAEVCAMKKSSVSVVRSVSRYVLAAIVAAGVFEDRAAIQAQAQFQTTPTAFSGQATAVTGTVLGQPITLADTGSVSPGGGTLEMHLLCYPPGTDCTVSPPDLTNGALGVDVLNATVVAQGNKSAARASVADLTLNAAGQTISASFLQAEAEAQCSSGQASVRGDSEIAQLVINGREFTVAGTVNETIPLPAGGVVILNEQVGSANAGSGGLTVSALHIRIPGVVPGTDTDLSVAKAHADIQCGQKFCPTENDFVTGGGWLASPRASFAVAGGIKNGSGWGHLLFIDHDNRIKVKGTGVTAYVPTPGTTRRHIEGTCEINGAAGTYQVDVDDRGEPGGGRDVFQLSAQVPGGLTVQAGGVISGGNIQLHTCR
jgi:hypothetical protein